MTVRLLYNKKTFVISNLPLKECEDFVECGVNDEFNWVYGYCFTDSTVLHNQQITRKQLAWLQENHSSISGIFSIITSTRGNISLMLDPLVQFNLFYYVNGSEFIVSNNFISLVKLVGKNFEIEIKHLFDQIAYQSPLRGLTFLQNIFAFQYDDLYNSYLPNSIKDLIPLKYQNFVIRVPDPDFYCNKEYDELIEIYSLGEDDLHLKLILRTDSYGDNEFVSSIQIVKPIVKQVTDFEPIK
jgi:hypothetical protein